MLSDVGGTSCDATDSTLCPSVETISNRVAEKVQAIGSASSSVVTFTVFYVCCGRCDPCSKHDGEAILE